jgi:hypothetical protein
MKPVRVAFLSAILAVTLAGCSGYSHWGVAPDDALGQVQADSACDYGRGANDPGSPCYVSQRPWHPPGE